MADDVKTYELPNGLKLFVQEDHRAPVVVSQIWYKVGSSYEPNGITGISHALEHMMFKGTQKYGPGEFSRIIAENGGEENAFTDRDYTVYYQVMDAAKLSISFEMEADRMRNLIVDPKEFAKEIQVVMEERRMRVEDNPQALAYERFMAMSHISTNYHHMPIGWMLDLQNMKAEDLQKWYQKWYAPNNAFIVVVGDVKSDEVYELAKKYFGPLQSSELPITKPQMDLVTMGEQNQIVKVPAQLPWFIMGYTVPVLKTDANSNDPYVLAVISALLDGGASARLDKNLIRGKQIAASISVSYDPFSRLGEVFKMEGIPSKNSTVVDLRNAIISEIEQLKNTLVTLEELKKVKTGVIASKVYAKDSISHQALEIGSLEGVGLSWKLRDEYVDRISDVTPEQVQAVVKKYFITDNLSTTELQPLPLDQNKKSPPMAQNMENERVH